MSESKSASECESEREREPDLRNILAAMTDLVFAFDAEGRFVFYHAPRIEDLYVPPERFLGRPHGEVLPPHVQERFQEAWRAVQEGRVAEYEYPLEIRGRERWFSAKLSPVFREGRFAGAVAVIREVTERRLSEEILRQLNNLVLVADEHGTIVYASPASRTLLGYEPEELLGDGWWHLSREDPEEARREKEHVARQARGEEPISPRPYERAIRHRSGEIRWILWTDSKGPGNTVIGVGYDITERRELIQQLAESEARYRDLFENANDAIYTLDRRGRFTSFNRRAEELTGFSRHEILGKPYHRVLPPRERAKARRSFLRNLQGEPDTFELVLRRKDGAEIVVELSTRPLWHGQEVVGVQGIARDITERVELDRMKSEFVSLVSHELRTPLTSIKGYTDLLLAEDAGPLTETQREFLGIIAQNTRRLTDLINDLLEIERLESGRVPLALAPLDLRPVLEEVAQTFKVNAQDKGLDFRVELPESPLPVEGDRDTLVRVFSNLVSNAIKYTPKGSVTLRAVREEGSGRAVVEISDTGIGIPPEEQARIFEKFYRSSHEYARRVGGTGLGLAIVRAIVEQHGGTVSVESAPGRGSTFSVRLPLAREPESSRGAEDEGRPKRPLVLVVDDEPDIARLIQTYIQRMGYRVVGARTGREALQKARELQPDLITLDVLLPDMDGFRALAALQRDPRTREIPVVFISIVQDEQRGLRLGACAYLQKPLDEERLRAVIRRFLPRAEASERLSSLPVLLVDDDPDYARLLRGALERAGYRVDVARDGEEALARIARNRKKYQLVLLDLKLPGPTGLEVLRKLRAEPATRDLPVILISGFAPTEDAEREIEILGAEKFLSKGLRLPELVREIDRVLARGSERKGDA